jgi:hypothetical protein
MRDLLFMSDLIKQVLVSSAERKKKAWLGSDQKDGEGPGRLSPGGANHELEQ